MSASTSPLDASLAAVEFALPPRLAPGSADTLIQIARLGLGEQFPLVAQLTRELFGEDFTVSIERDAEIDDWYDIVFTVRAAGSMEEILGRNTTWHRRLPDMTAQARGAFCPSIDEQP